MKIFHSTVILLENKGLFFSCTYMHVSDVYSTQTRDTYLFLSLPVWKSIQFHTEGNTIMYSQRKCFLMASSKLVKNIEESLVFDSNILGQTPSVLTALAINYNSDGKAGE